MQGPRKHPVPDQAVPQPGSGARTGGDPTRFASGAAFPSGLSGLAVDQDPAVPDAGQATFRGLLAAERRSLRWSAALITDLCDSAAPMEVIATATRMARTEAEHVALCAQALRQLGGVVHEAHVPEPGAVHQGWPATARVVRTMTEMLCVEATLSAAMLASMRRAARNDTARALLERLHTDECEHAEFGWSWLERRSRHLALGMRDWVMDWLPELLADAEARSRPTLAQVTRAQVGAPCAYGGLSAAEREVAFLRAMHERILPGLRRVGLDGTAAWSMRPERHAA